MTNKTPAGELTDEQLNTLLVSYGKGDDDCYSVARAIIEADRALRQGDAAMPVVAWEAMHPNMRKTWTDVAALAAELRSQSCKVAPLVRQFDTQAALAAKEAELIALANEVRPDLPEPIETADQAMHRIRKLADAHSINENTLKRRGERIDALEAEIAEFKEDLEHSRQWHDVRYKRLWRWAHEKLSEDLKAEYFSIVANGSGSANANANESPVHHRARSYAGQCLNAERYHLLRLHVTAVRFPEIPVPGGWGPVELDAAIDKALAQACASNLPKTETQARLPITDEGLAAQPAAGRKPQGYRLLNTGEAICEGDEFMDDDTVTWHPVRKGFCGSPWGGAWQPMRRAIPAARAAGGVIV